MRMVRQPRTSCASPGHIGTNGNDLGHLQPAEQPVHRRRVPHVSPSAPGDVLRRSEPAEEQKKITGADTFSRQVTLRDVHLPERWLPPRPTRKCTHLKIRVEMTAIIPPDAATGQIFNEGSEGAVAPSNVSKPRRTPARRNGQGHDGAIRQDRARNPAVAGVESLAAQHDLHLPVNLHGRLVGTSAEHTHDGDLGGDPQVSGAAPPPGDLASGGLEKAGVANQRGARDVGVGDRHGAVRHKRTFWPNSVVAGNRTRSMVRICPLKYPKPHSMDRP